MADNIGSSVDKIGNLAGSEKTAHQHKARARVEAEAFEAALLLQVQTPVQIALAKTASSFYLAVRTYHWRRMARAKQRPKELAEAVAAGNALDRMLETLGLIPNQTAGPANADSRTTAHRKSVESGFRPEPYCTCMPGDIEQCEKCKARRGAA